MPPYTNIIKAQYDADLEEKTAEMNTDSRDLGFQRIKSLLGPGDSYDKKF